MMFLCICTDKPGSGALRQSTRAAHLAYLDGRKDKIVLAGPMLAEDGQTSQGSFFILELPDRAAAEEQIGNDPYTKAGLFESTIIRAFRKVLP